MTEDEAKTKWCPMIRWTSAQNGLDSFENRGANCMCITSDCMMWRWKTEYSSITDNGNGTSTINWGANKRTEGGCGLGGTWI